nr:bifunctional DNA primase/polymerase [Novosphingobium sp.]
MTGGIFSIWQPEYEAAGLVVFPVNGDLKKPVVGNYLKAGFRASREWAGKFPDADALGIACGRRNRLTVLDVDAPDERLLADAMAMVGGESPVIVRTASGKFHAWYQHAGERRRIKGLMPGKPVDVLGNGFALAPPSITAKGSYRFIQGSLADLDRLPVMRLPKASNNALPDDPAPLSPALVQAGERNNTLFRLAMQLARECNTIEDLEARTEAMNLTAFADPLPAYEVAKIVANVWGKTQTGQNWFGGSQRLVITYDDLDAWQGLGPDAFSLAMILRREHWSRPSFFVANAMADSMPGGRWTVKRFAAARSRLLNAGVIRQILWTGVQKGPR